MKEIRTIELTRRGAMEKVEDDEKKMKERVSSMLGGEARVVGLG